MDTCKTVHLATRTTILATALLCQLNRHLEAASLFIRMTGDDSDLRSALFLEQASKCYLKVSPQLPMNRSYSHDILTALTRSTSIDSVGTFGSRYRKTAFHYVLAGHRYNRCGLKHFALSCYKRYNYPDWEAASDHVNLTVAKLYMNIASTNSAMANDFNSKALEIYQLNSHKQVFFNEYLRELKSRNITSINNDEACQIRLPFVHSFSFNTLDSVQFSGLSSLSKQNPIPCCINEPVQLALTLSSPFSMKISNIVLICDQPESQVKLDCETQFFTLEANQKTQIVLQLTARSEIEFSLLGIEFTLDATKFATPFQENLMNILKFKSAYCLPLIPIGISIPQLGLTTQAISMASQFENTISIPVPVYASEILTLSLNIDTTKWTPSSIQLFVNAKCLYLFSEVTSDTGDPIEYPVPLSINQSSVDLQVQIPQNLQRHVITIRLVYSDQAQTKIRTVVRKLSFNIVQCLQQENKIDSVITLKNLSPTDSVAIFDVATNDHFSNVVDSNEYEDQVKTHYMLIPPSQSAHLLMLRSYIRWAIPSQVNRNGTLVYQ